MENSEMTNLKIQFLELQKQRLLLRLERQAKRNDFIKGNIEKIMALSMDGWPKTKNMKDYVKWLDIVYDAKIKGVYSVGTANCDVIANINRFAKEISKH